MDATDQATWTEATEGQQIMEGWVNLPARIRHDHELDWYVLVSIAAQEVRTRVVLQLDDVDWSAVGATGWCGPIFCDADQQFRRRSGVTFVQDGDGRTWIGLDVSGATKTVLDYVDGRVQFVARTVTLEP